MAVTSVLRSVLDKLSFRELSVAEVAVVSPSFRRIELEGESLRAAAVAPGDKVQVMLGLVARTYTPFAIDRERGRMSLLVHLHGEGPGAAWGRQAAGGQRVRVFGPRGSLKLDRVQGRALLFGDETSFAVAHCLQQSAAARTQFVFEVERPDEARAVLTELGIATDGVVQKKSPDGRHLLEVEERVRAWLAARPDAHVVFTGAAPAIQRLRKQLKSALPPLGNQLAKAYWAPGKRGLD